MADLCTAAEALARSIGSGNGLAYAVDYHEIFLASLNAPEAVSICAAALDAEGIP